MKNIKSLMSLLALLVFSSLALGQTEAVPGDRGFIIAGATSVASVTVGTPGTGYTSLPTVAFSSGGGSVQATGTATLKVVGTPTVTAGGTGYTVGDVLTVQGGTKTATATLTVATVSSGAVASVTVTNAGVYTVIPANAVAVTGGTGTGATFTLGYGVATVSITSGGTGYNAAPTVAFTGGGGASAAGTAVLASYTVNAKFKEIIPLSDSIIASITFAERAKAGRPPYAGDSGIIGKTLTKGVPYTIYGDSITLTSGQAMLIIRQ